MATGNGFTALHHCQANLKMEAKLACHLEILAPLQNCRAEQAPSLLMKIEFFLKSPILERGKPSDAIESVALAPR